MLEVNIHKPVMLDELKQFIPNKKNINVIDATFGGGSYSREILENYDINYLIAIDRDPITNIFAKDLIKKYKNFKLVNGCFGKINQLVKSNLDNNKIKFDLIIFDLGLSSNQLNNPNRGFSFKKDGPLNMNMGSSDILASDVINKLSEKDLSNIFFELGEEKYAKKIAKKIVSSRKIKLIQGTKELSNLINTVIPFSVSKKSKIDPATKSFQALRIYVNDEINELKSALNNSKDLLKINGKLIVVSFQSLEDRIVKDFFNHNSGKRWRSSRHYPELADKGPITFKIITKKPIRPGKKEVEINPSSRSAKLRVAEKIN